jgi:hypothetical protein
MNSPATPRLPEQLTVGTHLTLDDGACLMECVSVLAGQPWSDAPTTTHPLLAHLGRLANDAMTSAGRQSLRPLASRLARLNSSDPAIHGAIAELATRYGLQVRPTPAVAWMHASALRHVRLSNRPAPGGRARGTLRQLRLRAYRRGPAYRALEAAVVTLCRASDSDGHLQRVLEQAVALVETSASAHTEVCVLDTIVPTPGRIPPNRPHLST